MECNKYLARQRRRGLVRVALAISSGRRFDSVSRQSWISRTFLLSCLDGPATHLTASLLSIGQVSAPFRPAGQQPAVVFLQGKFGGIASHIWASVNINDAI